MRFTRFFQTSIAVLLVCGGIVAIAPAAIADDTVGAASTTECPDGFELDGDLCSSNSPSIELPDACPEGAFGDPDQDLCYVLVEPEGVAACDDFDVLINGLCTYGITYVDLQNPNSGMCPDFAPSGAQLINGECILILTYEPYAPCPVGSIRGLENECWMFVETVTDRAGCADPAALLEDDSCIVFADALVTGVANAPAVQYPGPFENAPAVPSSGVLTAPDIESNTNLETSTMGALPAAEEPELAYTGTDTNMAMIALTMLCVGSTMMLASRRR